MHACMHVCMYHQGNTVFQSCAHVSQTLPNKIDRIYNKEMSKLELTVAHPTALSPLVPGIWSVRECRETSSEQGRNRQQLNPFMMRGSRNDPEPHYY